VCERMLDLRRVARKQVEVADRNRPLPVQPDRVDDGVECDQRDCDIGRMGSKCSSRWSRGWRARG
jgi:hypothetical protein